MSMGGGSKPSGNTTSTQTQTPWGPQQGYLQDIFGRAQTLANSYSGNVQQSPLYNLYIQQALQQSQSGLPGGQGLYDAYNTALTATSRMLPRIQDTINAGYDPNIGTRLTDLINSGYTPNQAMGYTGDVLKDIGVNSATIYDRGGSLLNEIGSNTGVSQNLQNNWQALNDFWKEAYDNQSIDALRQMSGSQWSNPYTSGLMQGGGQAAANPYMQQIVGAATAGNQYIPGIGGAAQQQTGNPLIDAIMFAGNQGNQYIPGLSGVSGMSNPFTGAFLDVGNIYNPYISGTADSASLAMANPALAQLQQTASGAYLTPDTNPYLQQAVQAAQEQSMANIASQFNQGGRYGSGMMAGTQAHELGNIAATAYAGQYEAERAKQLAAQQALGGQYLQGVGQLTAGQQAAGQMQQQQQGIGLGALGQAAGLTQQQIQNIISGQATSAELTQAQQQLGLGAATSAGGLTQQGLANMLQGLVSQAGLQQGQQQLGVQGIGQAGEMYGTGMGQLLSALQAAGGLRGQQQQLSQQAMTEAGQQYGTAAQQALQSQIAAGDIAQNQVGNTQNAYGQFMQAQNLRAQQELAGAGLLGNLSASDLDRQFQAQQAGTQGYFQNIANMMQSQQAGTDAYLASLGLQTQAMGFAPQLMGMQDSRLGQLGNAAQIQQQLMQAPEQQQWGNLANYLAMVQGSYGGVGKSQTPYYQNQAGSAMGGALGGAGMGMMLGGPWGAAAGGGLGLLGGLFSNRVFKNEAGSAPVDAVAERLRNLPIGVWRYRGDESPHIGPYAEDFREAFGLGNGVTIPVVDAIGVLFSAVQHLMVQNDDLRTRLEELKNAV